MCGKVQFTTVFLSFPRSSFCSLFFGILARRRRRFAEASPNMVEAGNLPPPAPPPPIPDEVKFQMETARFIFFGVASVLMTIKLTTFADGSKTSFLWTSIALLTITLIISLFTNVLGMYFYNLPPYPKWVKILNSCSYTLVTLAAILSLGA